MKDFGISFQEKMRKLAAIVQDASRVGFTLKITAVIETIAAAENGGVL